MAPVPVGRNLHTWMAGYLRHLGGRAARRADPRLRRPHQEQRHLMFAVCDHFEPLWGKDTTIAQGEARVAAWQAGYPALVDGLRDADGLTPRHTFFFPGEQYDPVFLDGLARLCAAGHGEVEFHLHHDGDTSDGLRRAIPAFLDNFARHGHVSRAADGNGEAGGPGTRYRYAFIHGNWCLANARRDGRWCGVDDELAVLHETGCYADFTFPSAPDECQPGLVNVIYWPRGDLTRRRAHGRGERARRGVLRHDRPLLITGPLAITRRAGRLRPRIESAALAHDDPPSRDRLRAWLDQEIHIAGRPDWLFVKVHTHGAPERNAAIMLGAPARAMHRDLADLCAARDLTLHYVTAREMYNIAFAAMEGRRGNPADHRDLRIPPPPIAPPVPR